MTGSILFQQYIIWITIILSTLISSYATFLGFETQLTLFLSVALATLSGFALFSLDFLVFRLFRSHIFILLKIPAILSLVGAIFCFSTVWSIVGLARNEIFAKQVSEINHRMLSNFDYNKKIIYFEKADLILLNLLNLLDKGHKNALEGKYSGIREEGAFSINFNSLSEKIKITVRDLNKQNKLLLKEINEIESMTKKLVNSKEYSGKEEYVLLLNETNNRINKLNYEKTKPLLDYSVGIMDKTINLFKKLRDERVRDDGRKGLVDVEIIGLENAKSSIEDLRGDLASNEYHLNLNPLGVSVISLSFKYFIELFNWWSICLIIDFIPIPLWFLTNKGNYG